MASDLPFYSRLKAIALALGITGHQQLPTPPDRRASKLLWNGRLSARHAYVAGKLWDSLDAEISAGGYCARRRREKTFDLKTARALLGTREEFVSLAQKQFSLQRPGPNKREKKAPTPLLNTAPEYGFPTAFNADWVLFAPFCPGADATANQMSDLKYKSEDQDSITFSVEGNISLELRWFKWGAAVWTSRIPLELPNLTLLGIQRVKQYNDILHGSHAVRDLTSRINDSIQGVAESQSPIGYAFSLYSLNKPCWQHEVLPHALKVMSCPNMLLDLVSGRDRKAWIQQLPNERDMIDPEMKLLTEGIGSPDLHEFAHPGVLHGYASWAGVSMHVAEPTRQPFFATCVAFEQELQALWWRLHSISQLLQKADTAAKYEALQQTLRIAVQKALRIGPNEPTHVRLFKEAVIATSRFKSVFEDFLQLCHNRRELL